MKETELLKLINQFLSENCEIITNYKLKKSDNKLSLIFELDKTTESISVLKEPVVVEEAEVTEEEEVEEEPEPEVIEKPIEEVTVQEVTTQEDEPVKNPDRKFLSTCNSLYGNHEFTQDEIECVTAYINKEITGPEGAELLNLNKVSDFYNIVERIKRAKNITANSKNPEGNKKPGARITQKISDADLDYIYGQIRRGDTMVNLAKDYKVAQSTLSKRLHSYIIKNNLEPLFIDGKRNTNIGKGSKTKSAAKEKTTKAVKPAVPKDTPDGWGMASDNKFHLVKDGEIVK